MLVRQELGMRIQTLTRSAPEALKEVARMNSIHIAKTDHVASRFGMPVYGRTLGAVTGAACGSATTVVLAARVSGMGRIKGDFPGTSAWRPPS